MKDILNKNKKFFEYVVDTGYGREKQKEKAVEELRELIEAIENDDRENVIEEMGDVIIMLFQLKYIYRIPFEKLLRWVQFKIDRLKKRIGWKELEEC